jgi:hypothetical protein
MLEKILPSLLFVQLFALNRFNVFLIIAASIGQKSGSIFSKEVEKYTPVSPLVYVVDHSMFCTEYFAEDCSKLHTC